MLVEALNYVEYRDDYGRAGSRGSVGLRFCYVTLHHFLRHDEQTATVQGKTLERIGDFMGVGVRAVRKYIAQMEKDGKIVVLSYGSRDGKQAPNDYIMIGFGTHKGFNVDPSKEAKKIKKRAADRAKGVTWNQSQIEGADGTGDPSGQTGADGTGDPSADGTGDPSINTGELQDIEITNVISTQDGTGKPLKYTKGAGIINLPKPTFGLSSSSSTSEDVPAVDIKESPKKTKGKPKEKRGKTLTAEQKEKRDAVFWTWVEHLKDRWGYDLSSGLYGRERSSAMNLVKKGLTPEQVVDVYDAAKLQWGTEGHLSLNGIVNHAEAFLASKKAGTRVNQSLAEKVGRQTIPAKEVERVEQTMDPQDHAAMVAEINAIAERIGSKRKVSV